MSATEPTTFADSSRNEPRCALVTGATGYVGGEVVPELLQQGWRVRVITRSPHKLDSTSWSQAVIKDGTAGAGEVEVVEGDASDDETLEVAMKDVDVAWYLLHSMGEGEDFEEREKEMARDFGTAAKTAGVSRIVYLGGLHPEGEELSTHLRSRVAVGEELMNSGVPTAALQAGVVIGDGSSSFIMLRNLAERLPVMAGPSWINNQITPIAVRDAVYYLVKAADLAPEHNRTFDIGGPDDLSYAEMTKEYANARGLLPRVIATAPITTRELAASWMGLFTPVPTAMTKPLIDSLQHDTVQSEDDLAELVGEPDGGRLSFHDAVLDATKDRDARTWPAIAAASVAAVTGAALLANAARKTETTWYQSLEPTRVDPPSGLIAAVQPVMYASLAAVGALSVADLGELGRKDDQRIYAGVFAGHLALNIAVPVAFYRAKAPKVAAALAVGLAGSAAELARQSSQITPMKWRALVPYVAWTGLGAVMTAASAWKNR